MLIHSLACGLAFFAPVCSTFTVEHTIFKEDSRSGMQAYML